MDKQDDVKVTVTVELNEERYKQLNAIVEYLQSFSISVVTKQSVIEFLIATMYKNEVLEEGSK
ncbi:hypothetical protein V7094_29450 [Priestia megaterium]|uniref:hypothetical protein n=1 Tax=Priestia megaterium TaxID=1404 RepID=UPI002FFE36A6